MTYSQGIKEFLASLRRSGYSSRTLSAYEFDLIKFAEFIGDFDIPIDNLDKNIIKTWIDSCLLHGNSTRTVARKLATLKSFFNFLMDESLLTASPVEHIPLPRAKRKLPSCLSQDEIRQLISSPSPDEPEFLRNRAILTLMYSCGIRVSEVVSLKMSGVSLEHRSVRIEGKGAKERILPLTDSAFSAILEYFTYREKSSPRSIFPGSPAFLSSKGQPMTVRMIQYMVQKYGLSAGISTHVHPHLIRHSIASHLVDEGCHIEAVRQTLGHEDLATTSIYLSTASGFLAKEHEKFNPSDRLLASRKTDAAQKRKL